MLTSQGISQKASPWSKPAAALLLAVVAALPLGAATGVLVEAPRRVVGIEIFPRTVVPYHSARYEVEGTALDVYYTASELPLPGNPEIDACGTRELQRIDEPMREVRVLEHEGETLIFAWDSGSPLDICDFVLTFLDDFDFFRNALPGDRGSWLPATVE
ncbi:MAG: hypothetical protein ACLFNQ_03850 [Spirochaetaceae bacterium]